MEQPPIRAQASALARDFTLGETKMPKLVYGTAWKGDDTAAQPKHYREDLVGDGVRRAIREGIVARGDLFVRAAPVSCALLVTEWWEARFLGRRVPALDPVTRTTRASRTKKKGGH